MNITKLNALKKAMQGLYEIDPNLNLKQIVALLEVATNQGVSGRDLESILDTNHATANRVLRSLDKVQANGSKGLDVVETYIDPADYRSKLRKLNDKGMAAFRKMDESLSRGWA